MAVRPEVVALLTDFDVEHTSSGQRFVHRMVSRHAHPRAQMSVALPFL
jgi:hypothetical protein